MNCPLCKKETNKVLTKKLRKGEERLVYHCQSCDLGILDEQKSAVELKEYYKKTYRREYKPDLSQRTDAQALFESYVDFQQDRLRLVAPYLGKEKRLLEIGCSVGMFLYHVKDKVKEAVGMDFDQRSAEFAAKKCNCQVYTKPILETPLKEESFDVICVFQVLEHVKDPLEFLLQIKKYLKNDGVLHLEVPNLKDILVSTYNLPYHQQFYFHAAHLYYFTTKSLLVLLSKAGFAGKIHFSQDYNIVNHFHWLLNDQPQKNCLPGLSKPEFSLQANVDLKTKDSLNSFLAKIDREYKQLLEKLELASNIAFVGKKNG